MKLRLIASGMVTPVGFNARASCAAMRAALNRFQETRFTFDGEWLVGSRVDLPSGAREHDKDLQMVASAVIECLQQLPTAHPGDTALYLILPELARVGRAPWLEQQFAKSLVKALPGERVTKQTSTICHGALSAVEALLDADRMLEKGTVRYCVIAGVDSFLRAETLKHAHAQHRLLTGSNADGYLPGEAAAAIALTRDRAKGGLACTGIGFGDEPTAGDSDIPLRGDGLVTAYKSALAMAGCGWEVIDYRLCDIAGEINAFREASLAMSRTLRQRKEAVPLWHPGDCIGRVGAATIPLLLGVALLAHEKGYAPGAGVLCHAGEDDGRRAALVLRGWEAGDA